MKKSLYQYVKGALSDRYLAMGYFNKSKVLNILSDKAYYSFMYTMAFHKRMHFKNPKTFNEKIQWLKLYDRKPEYAKMVDKYEAREVIKKMMGEQYLVKLYGVWDSVDEIPFNELPKQFVLKCTHDSGGVVVCKDKEKLNIEEAKKKLKDCLSVDYYKYWREWPYKNVKPRIIAEQYLVGEDGKEISDYKVFCFNGKPKFYYVSYNKGTKEGASLNYYTMQGKKIPVRHHLYPNYDGPITKPKHLDKMVQLSKIAAKGFDFLRVDFYESEGKLYAGELTLYPCSGYANFEPYKYDEIWGEYMTLHGIKSGI